jgi:hypothetical protein
LYLSYIRHRLTVAETGQARGPASTSTLHEYWSLRIARQTEIDADAWASLNSDTSWPFDQPKSGKIAVKVIDHLGDKVMKVFRV